MSTDPESRKICGSVDVIQPAFQFFDLRDLVSEVADLLHDALCCARLVPKVALVALRLQLSQLRLGGIQIRQLQSKYYYKSSSALNSKCTVAGRLR